MPSVTEPLTAASFPGCVASPKGRKQHLVKTVVPAHDFMTQKGFVLHIGEQVVTFCGFQAQGGWWRLDPGLRVKSICPSCRKLALGG